MAYYYNYELLTISSKIACPENKFFRSSIWVIIVTELSISLIQQELFDAQHDSATCLTEVSYFLTIGIYNSYILFDLQI